MNQLAELLGMGDDQPASPRPKKKPQSDHAAPLELLSNSDFPILAPEPGSLRAAHDAASAALDADVAMAPSALARSRQATREWILEEYEGTGLSRRLSALDLQVGIMGAALCSAVASVAEEV